MPVWFQNLLVLVAVAACLVWVIRQAFRSLNGRKSRLNGCGSCGGCGTPARPATTNSAAPAQIIPVEMLRRRK